MNFNPFNFQQTPQWGTAAEKHLNHIVRGQDTESKVGKFETSSYTSKAPVTHDSANRVIETSTHGDIKRWLTQPEGERGSLTF